MNTNTLKLIRLKKQDWNILVTADNIEQALENTKNIVPFIENARQNVIEVIRDDARSFVASTRLYEKKYIIKSPHDKNRRRWTRLTTFFVEGEAFRTIRNMTRLKNAGVNVARPFMALEKRRFGMVTDSWIIYEYLKISPDRSPDFKGIIKQLDKIHSAGRVHADSGKQNFILSNGRVFVIDCRTRKKLWGRISECYDFVLLENSAPEAREALGETVTSIPFQIAKHYNNGVRGWRRFKKNMRERKQQLSKAEKKTRKTFLKYLQYLVLVTLSQGLRVISHKTLIRIADLFGTLGFILLPKPRKLGAANIMKVLNCDETSALEVVRKSFKNTARAFLEIPFFRYSDEGIADIPLHGLEHIEKSRKLGRGIVCITGHIGNWDVLGKIMSRNGIVPTGIARRLHNPYVDEWISRVRASYGSQVIYQGRSVTWNKKIIRTLKNNGNMFFIMDQYISGGLKAEFCGYRVPTPTGAYRMAKTNNSPVHLVYMLMNKEEKYEVFISPEIKLIEKNDRDEEMLANTELFNRRLEEVIKANPDQWLCFHKRFRKCERVWRKKS